MTAPLRTCRTACGCACMAPGPGGVELHLRAGACYTEPCSCAGNLGVQLPLVLVCSRNNFAGMMKSATSPSRQNHPLRLQPLGPIASRDRSRSVWRKAATRDRKVGGGPAAVAAWRKLEAWAIRVRVCIGRWRWRPDIPELARPTPPQHARPRIPPVCTGALPHGTRNIAQVWAQPPRPRGLTLPHDTAAGLHPHRSACPRESIVDGMPCSRGSWRT